MSEWKEYKVHELINLGYIYKPLDGNHGNIHPKHSDFVNDGIPFITAADVNNGNIDLINCKFISYAQAKSLKKGFAREGDVLLTHKASLGRTAIVPKLNNQFIVLTPQVTYYRVKDKSKINNKFLKYYFNSPFFQETLYSHGSSGSTRDYVGIIAQNDLPIILPTIQTQEQIAEVLSSLDDKIDLLHRQNKTLEQMAETLFRQWFVEEAKEDWEEKPLDHLAEYLNGLALQKFPAMPGKPTLPAIKIREMNQGITESTDIVSAEIPEKYIINDGDILFSWSGSLDVIIWTGGKGALNQHLFKVTSSTYPKWLIYFSTRLFLPEFRDIANDKATTMGHIQRSHLTQSVLKIPPQKIIEKSDKIISDLFDKIIHNKIQIRSIEKLRDTLLPKLMNGSVRINSN